MAIEVLDHECQQMMPSGYDCGRPPSPSTDDFEKVSSSPCLLLPCEIQVILYRRFLSSSYDNLHWTNRTVRSPTQTETGEQISTEPL
ncbi:hypothetical protein COCON_G00081600 [Conger conger]|uniref:Uncharacterized protein n=1 Tax=Conger conger TaxID=82655 RepID=A0A9Q1DPR6_CONCO|nr:hypothetical protein COCON_G00081600 [Conger conger]